MSKTKIMPGELFIVEYVDGKFSNEWAINASKDYIEISSGRKVSTGFTDVLVQPEEGKNIIDSRFHITKNAEAIVRVKDLGFYKQPFAEIELQVLKIAKETDIHDRLGAVIGKIPAGTLIGTQYGDAGNSMRHLMYANAYNDGSGWKFLNHNTYSYGFVNIQKGHGLQQFDPSRALITSITETEFDIDWNLVDSVAKTEEPEKLLRGDLSLLSKDEVVSAVKDHFASVDLLDVDLMDPVQFLANDSNRQFIVRELAKVDPVKAEEFESVALTFLNE